MFIIEAEKKRSLFKELWDFRELIYFFSWSQLLVRYKQTSIGLLWTVLRPVLVVAVFSLIFGRIAHLSGSFPFPYFLIVLSGLLPWQFFSTATADCSECFLQHSNLISKVYFPRLILPLSSLVVGMVEFTVTLALLFFVWMFYGIPLTWSALFLFPLIVLTFIFSFGFGLWLAIFNIQYRDFRYVIPFVLQMSLYASPVGFTSALFQNSPWKYILGLNPLVGIIEGYRFALFPGTLPFDPILCIESTIITAFLFFSAIGFFKKFERRMIDIL